MEYLGILLEFVLLGVGIYFYLLAIGQIKGKTLAQQERIDTFRSKNGTWLRILSLILMSVMVINIYLHFTQLIK